MWAWLREPDNRKVLTWLGSGLVVVAGGVWVVFTYLYPPKAGSAPPSAEVEHGVGAGGDISVDGRPNHPDVGITLSNLAALYQAQDRDDDAEPPLMRALEITEAALGPDHPDVGIRLNHLALLYRAQGRYDDAEPLYNCALEIQDRTLPPDHSYNIVGAENYASLLRQPGRDDEAARWETKAAATCAAREPADPAN